MHVRVSRSSKCICIYSDICGSVVSTTLKVTGFSPNKDVDKNKKDIPGNKY